jgi:hypothetical protein
VQNIDHICPPQCQNPYFIFPFIDRCVSTQQLCPFKKSLKKSLGYVLRYLVPGSYSPSLLWYSRSPLRWTETQVLPGELICECGRQDVECSDEHGLTLFTSAPLATSISMHLA